MKKEKWPPLFLLFLFNKIPIPLKNQEDILFYKQTGQPGEK